MRIYNSLSKKTEEFSPLEKSNVSLYVCGITPYDTTHLGHAFLYTFFDAVVRVLTYKGFAVNYTQNVTDIDDDILKRAKQEGKDWKELGQFWTDKFIIDLKNLNIQMPTHYVKATDSIASVTGIIEVLIQKEFAYEVNGNVYFDIAKFPEYGKLSGFNKDQMMQISKERGGNIEDANKRNPLDFLLWQKSTNGEPSWDSPWGQGRPGWHIECSAMASDYLGNQIDLHGGGRDLIYPHHESEIAQTESFTGKKPFVGHWMHVGMVMYQGEKMSKSLGNLVMVSDLLKSYSSDVIRFVLLSHSYRKPWEFFQDELVTAESALNSIKTVIKQNLNEIIDEKELGAYIENDFDLPSLLSQLQIIKNSAIVAKYMGILGFSMV